MPIIQHPACIEPAPDTPICRFMDFNKFRDFFANEELYFRRTDLFKETDPSEALPSDEYVRAACGLRKYDLDDERALNNNQAFARQNSEAYFISCWQRSVLMEPKLGDWIIFKDGARKRIVDVENEVAFYGDGDYDPAPFETLVLASNGEPNCWMIDSSS
jgi:hypothetical protein